MALDTSSEGASTMDGLFMEVFFFFFSLSRATPTAYGGSQARGQIGTVVPELCHRTAMPELSHVCELHRNSHQWRILNPLSNARD